jgi:hypothetical protein
MSRCRTELARVVEPEAVQAMRYVHTSVDGPDPPGVEQLLQRCHIILSREHHAVHRSSPFDTRYCITSGIMNRWIDRSGLLFAAEPWILSQRRRSK